MKIKLVIPAKIAATYDRYEAWVNEPIWTRGKLEARRIDVVIAIGFVVCVSWYGYTGGWTGALAGGLMYTMMAMVALWLL